MQPISSGRVLLLVLILGKDNPGMGDYTTSKAGVIALSKGIG